MKTNKSIVECFGIALQVILSIIVIVIMILFSKDDPWLPIMGLLIIYLIWEKKLIDSKSKKENKKIDKYFLWAIILVVIELIVLCIYRHFIK